MSFNYKYKTSKNGVWGIHFYVQSRVDPQFKHESLQDFSVSRCTRDLINQTFQSNLGPLKRVKRFNKLGNYWDTNPQLLSCAYLLKSYPNTQEYVFYYDDPNSNPATTLYSFFLFVIPRQTQKN